MIGFFVFLFPSVCLPGSSITLQHFRLLYYRNITVWCLCPQMYYTWQLCFAHIKDIHSSIIFTEFLTAFTVLLKDGVDIKHTEGLVTHPGTTGFFSPSAVSPLPWFRIDAQQNRLICHPQSSQVITLSPITLFPPPSIHIASSPASHSSSQILFHLFPNSVGLPIQALKACRMTQLMFLLEVTINAQQR